MAPAQPELKKVSSLPYPFGHSVWTNVVSIDRISDVVALVAIVQLKLTNWSPKNSTSTSGCLSSSTVAARSSASSVVTMYDSPPYLAVFRSNC